MKRLKVTISLIILISLLGCNNASIKTNNQDVEEKINKAYQEGYDAGYALGYEEGKKEATESLIVFDETAEEPEEELTLANYDYKTDPDTIAVNITDENIDEYFDLKVVKSYKSDTYYVLTHSLMYDKGYVVVGEYYANCKVYGGAYELDGKVYEEKSDTLSLGSYTVCNIDIGHGFTDEATAQKYADKGIKAYIKMDYPDATIYYQKIEDVKFGYEMDDGKRIINGEEIRGGFFKDNPY